MKKRFWPRKFWKRYPMQEFQFMYRGNDSNRIEAITISANYEPQAEGDARQAFRDLYGEECTLLATWKK